MPPAAVLLVLPARLTHEQAGPVASALAARLASAGAGATASAQVTPPAVTVDASALEHFDSSALAVLLELRRAAQRTGASLHFTGLSARLQVLAGLYGVAELLPSA